MSISGVWPLRLIIIGSSTTLMLLHCISSWSRLKISSAREHLKANIPDGKRNISIEKFDLTNCSYVFAGSCEKLLSKCPNYIH